MRRVSLFLGVQIGIMALKTAIGMGVTFRAAARSSFSLRRPTNKSWPLLLGVGRAGNRRDAPATTMAAAKRLASEVKYRVPPSEIPQPERLLVVGDVHGDLTAFRECLRMADLVSSDGRWSGGKSVLIQCGDVFDRGESDLEVEEYLYQLGEEAQASGGTAISLLGNHEVMNACGDHSMAMRKAFEPFEDLHEEVEKFLSGQWEILAKFPEWAKCRIGAMLPAGPVAKLLAGHPIALKVGNTVIVHGGLLPYHVPNGMLSVRDMNKEAFEWLVGIKRSIPDNLMVEESPIWARKYSSPNDVELPDDACEDLRRTLETLGCERMVVGHTPQRLGINAAADGRIWRVDTGMTKMMGGRPEVLEILYGSEMRILTQDGPLEGDELRRLRFAPKGPSVGRFTRKVQ